MNRTAETTIDWIIAWIFQGTMTIIVAVGIVIIVQLYIKVQTPTGDSERALIIQKLTYDETLVTLDPVTLEFRPGRFDATKLENRQQAEKLLAEHLIYPKEWNERAVLLKIGGFDGPEIHYRPESWKNLHPRLGYRGKGASTQYVTSTTVVERMPSDTILNNIEAPRLGRWEVLELNS